MLACLEMEKEFESKMRLQQPQRTNSNITFKAPQENFSVDEFELGKLYGVGSYSKVIRAKKKDTGIVYAMKIMDKKFIMKENKTSYVKLERIVLDQLDHPGIIKIFFTFQDTYSLYMALESCEGGELFDLITRKGRLPEDEACFYAAEVIDVLEYMHSLGLIHRDIKPENLLLTADGHVKVADFGSVKPTKECQLTVLPNTSNERACSFVGTAAYVPPEVLNSSPATFGNDLWALGCTIYQMLSGSSPFKDASEWLIFQRIIARDLKIPEHFSDAARDLIDKLLDMDPSRRLGAGPDGYAALKSHAFFSSIDWKNLRQMPAPRIAREDIDEDDAQDSSWNLSHTGGGRTRQLAIPNGTNGATSSSEAQSPIAKLAKIDSFDSRWNDFLETGESIVMISKVKRLQTLSNKKVQLILTDKPRLICVDPLKMMAKGSSIIWSCNPSDITIQASDSSHFKITTPKKVMSFEDAKERALQWKKAIESFQSGR